MNESFEFTPGKISASDFHMGDAMRLLDLLKVEELHRVVIREDLGPMGATPVTWWSTKVGLILEEHSPMGGVSVIVHPAPGFTRVDMANAARDGFRDGVASVVVELPKMFPLQEAVNDNQKAAYNDGVRLCRRRIIAAGGRVKE